MRPFGSLLPFDEAENIVMSHILPIERVEEVSLEDCAGRVLAEDIIATMDNPPFSRAAVDGYALRAKDTFGASRQNPKDLSIIGVLHAGSKDRLKVKPGECVQVATGAPLPDGADAVVMVEDALKSDNKIQILRPLYPESGIARRGEDSHKGEVLLKKGEVLTPARVGVLASQGRGKITVYQKPEVAIIPTGEEVRKVGERLRRGEIYDINSYSLGAVVMENGGKPIRFDVAADRPETLDRILEEALKFDIVVLAGGSSVGERDLAIGVLSKKGEVFFHGIQIKPGKPTLFALINGKPVLGLPGYPTSCLINAYLLLVPALRMMARLPARSRITLRGMLNERVPGSVGRRQFLPARLEAGRVVPIFKESGTITGVAKADGYIIVPENVDIVEAGEEVEVVLFNNAIGA